MKVSEYYLALAQIVDGLFAKRL